jgi:excisionase family DNA binding protein
MTTPPQLLTINDAAATLRVSRPTVYRYMDEGPSELRLRYIMVGERRRITSEAIRDFIAAREGDRPGGPGRTRDTRA